MAGAVSELATVNGFRIRRGLRLRALIAELAQGLGRDVTILDVGGRPDYWENVGFAHVACIELLNTSTTELARERGKLPPEVALSSRIGNGCDLAEFDDQSVDLVHSNSVIEHVGGWEAMVAMAGEAMRVGRAGWIQTPAWEFPIEPHFRLPFMHWLGRPIQVRMIYYSPPWRGKRNDLHARRHRVERINLLSRREVECLFPGKNIYVERCIVPKSYCVYWNNLP